MKDKLVSNTELEESGKAKTLHFDLIKIKKDLIDLATIAYELESDYNKFTTEFKRNYVNEKVKSVELSCAIANPEELNRIKSHLKHKLEVLQTKIKSEKIRINFDADYVDIQRHFFSLDLNM